MLLLLTLCITGHDWSEDIGRVCKKFFMISAPAWTPRGCLSPCRHSLPQMQPSELTDMRDLQPLHDLMGRQGKAHLAYYLANCSPLPSTTKLALLLRHCMLHVLWADCTAAQLNQCPPATTAQGEGTHATHVRSRTTRKRMRRSRALRMHGMMSTQMQSSASLDRISQEQLA